MPGICEMLAIAYTSRLWRRAPDGHWGDGHNMNLRRVSQRRGNTVATCVQERATCVRSVAELRVRQTDPAHVLVGLRVNAQDSSAHLRKSGEEPRCEVGGEAGW